MRPITEKQLREEAERLISTGKMPSLEKLSQAVLETRMKFVMKVRRARREAQRKVAVN
jgi:hypothetical protein